MKELKEDGHRFPTASTAISRPKTQKTDASRNAATSITSRQSFVRGERVSQSAMTSLSALYNPAYSRYPTFPSIYESKYAHDFKYTFWPVEKTKREYKLPPDYSKFKFGQSHYTEEFPQKGPVNNQMITPISRHRMNNPHPRMRIVQDYPDSQRWIWSSPEHTNNMQDTRTSTTAERVRKWQRDSEPKWHRWNSR